MACQDYLVVDVPDCISPITVVAALTGQTEYLYRVQGDSGTAFWNTVTTDVNGSFEIDISLFPDTYFNRYSGLYNLQIYDVTTHGQINLKGYNAIGLRFQKTNLTEAIILA